MTQIYDSLTRIHPRLLPGDWVAQAACAGMDTDLFFPEGRGALPPTIKAICDRCPVRTQCLDLAVANKERFGIWGGVGEKTRRHIRRQRPAA